MKNNVAEKEVMVFLMLSSTLPAEYLHSQKPRSIEEIMKAKVSHRKILVYIEID